MNHPGIARLIVLIFLTWLALMIIASWDIRHARRNANALPQKENPLAI